MKTYTITITGKVRGGQTVTLHASSGRMRFDRANVGPSRPVKLSDAEAAQLREDGALNIYDGGERLLCWFLLDGKGAPVSWGNFWNGSINQHYYGPLADMGDANLPKWGVSTTGAFRFEYVRAALDDRPVEPPPR